MFTQFTQTQELALPSYDFVRQNRRHRVELFASDLLLLNGSFLLSLYLAMGDISLLLSNPLISAGWVFLMSGLWLLLGVNYRIYRWRERQSFDREVRMVMKTFLLHAGFCSIIVYNYFQNAAQSNFLLYFYCLAIPTLMASRGIIRRLEYRVYGAPIRYLLMSGNAGSVDNIIQAFAYRYSGAARCVASFGDRSSLDQRQLSTFEELVEYIFRYPVHKLVYVSSDLTDEQIKQLTKLCRTRFIDFEIIPREVGLFERGMKTEYYGNQPVLMGVEHSLFRYRNRLLKRAFDVVFSSLVILLVFPWLLPIIALAIRLESRGPIFFVQQRTGYFNKSFPCIKFRTMFVDNDDASRQARRGDSRITRVGAFLRKTSLDEFPQFFNVFMGDMSVVGPRPHMLAHTEEYARLIGDYMIRHEVKPGVTGWAQVNGWRGLTDTLYKMQKRVEYDVDYIENWNFWLDVKCIYMTVMNGVKGEENAF